jgi:hypothetical protein
MECIIIYQEHLRVKTSKNDFYYNIKNVFNV